MNSYSGNKSNFYKPNFNYNINNNINNNINHFNIRNSNNINMNNRNSGNNLSNNQTMNILLQYMNMMKFNLNNNNNNNYFNNNNLNNNPMNIFQLMPNLMNLGLNQPYSFDNVKKEQKKPSFDFNKKKFNYNYNNNFNNHSFSSNHNFHNNNNDNKEDFVFDDEPQKKFMRKMTKAEKIEIDKWVEARKKLYPTQKNIELKNKIGELKVEKGLISNLELKLRKKVNILKKLTSTKKLKRKNDNININYNQNKFKPQINKENDNNEPKINEEEEKINKEEKSLPEDGEINEENKSNDIGEKLENNCHNTKEDINNMLGRKRKNLKKNKCKKKIHTLNGNENNKENIFKKGFKYKINHLYDDLIKKDKIKEQNIILQAIRYLINIKNEKEE